MGALPPDPGADLASAVFLAVLAVASLALALVPAWRSRFHWGRSAGSYPVSRRGCLGVTLALLTMSFALGAHHVHLLEDDLAILIALAGFLVFIVAGLADRRAASRAPRA